MSVGDVVHGHVTDKSARELLVLVTSFIGSHKFRELSDIGVKVQFEDSLWCINGDFVNLGYSAI